MTLAQKIDHYAKFVVSTIASITVAATAFSTVGGLPAGALTAVSVLGSIGVLIKANAPAFKDIANQVDGDPTT